MIADARPVVGESRIGRPFGVVQQVAQPEEQTIVRGAERDEAVRAADGLIGREHAVRRTFRLRDTETGEVLGGFPYRQRNAGFDQRRVDVLAHAGAVAIFQRCQNAGEGEEAGRCWQNEGEDVADAAGEPPKCPGGFHFRETDQSIPREHWDRIRAAHPKIPLHVYPAGHGFACDERRIVRQMIAENLADYLALPSVIACGGSWVAPAAWIDERRFEHVRTEAERAVAFARAATKEVPA